MEEQILPLVAIMRSGALLYGYWEIVALLLMDERVDPAARANEAIRHASQNKHSKIVELLLADYRVYPLKLEELVNSRETIVTYLFQRYRQLLLIKIGSDIVRVIVELMVV